MSPKSNKQKYKIQAIQEKIHNSDSYVPFAVITETHWEDEILDAELTINNYNLYRADRINNRNLPWTKGGTAIYMHEDIAVNHKEVYSDTKCESLCLKNNDINFILVSVYKPPNSPELSNSFNKCLHTINQFIKTHNDNSTIYLIWNNLLCGI